MKAFAHIEWKVTPHKYPVEPWTGSWDSNRGRARQGISADDLEEASPSPSRENMELQARIDSKRNIP